MPGPYIKSFFDAIGVDGLWQLVEHQADKSASCECVLAFSAGPGAEPIAFRGRTEGRVVPPHDGGQGFGWDAIFVPDGADVPWGQMPMEAKNAISHRSRALAEFAAHIKANEAELLSSIARHSADEVDFVHDGDGLVWGTEKRLGRRSIV